MKEDDLRKAWDALVRLEAGEPLIVSPDDPINYDTVALEAGYKRGYFKASRSQHRNIRDAIDRAAKKQTESGTRTAPVSKAELKRKAKAERDRAEHYKELADQILAREIMLLRHVDKLERKIQELEGLRIVKFSERKAPPHTE